MNLSPASSNLCLLADGDKGTATSVAIDGRAAVESMSKPQRVDPDAELTRRAILGDQLAFDQIVRLHAERVRAVALRMLGDAFEADDVAQDVFVAAHAALPRFRGESSLKTWILRIARNHCLNRIKSRKRRQAGRQRLGDEVKEFGAYPGVAASTRGPEGQVLNTELRGQIEFALAQLPPAQRWLVTLRDIEGLSYLEVAEATGLRIGTVKSRLHRARNKLAQTLARYRAGLDEERS